MVGPGMFNGVGEMLIAGLVAIVLCIVIGLYSIIDFFWIPETYKFKEPLKPNRIELVIENNKVDTLYVYKLK